VFRDLNDEQRGFVESVDRFARDELAPGALARAHAAVYPWEVAPNSPKWAC
jgi:hypothetical protein